MKPDREKPMSGGDWALLVIVYFTGLYVAIQAGGGLALMAFLIIGFYTLWMLGSLSKIAVRWLKRSNNRKS